jgi:hypothetical protein
MRGLRLAPQVGLEPTTLRLTVQADVTLSSSCFRLLTKTRINKGRERTRKIDADQKRRGFLSFPVGLLNIVRTFFMKSNERQVIEYARIGSAGRQSGFFPIRFPGIHKSGSGEAEKWSEVKSPAKQEYVSEKMK